MSRISLTPRIRDHDEGLRSSSSESLPNRAKHSGYHVSSNRAEGSQAHAASVTLSDPAGLHDSQHGPLVIHEGDDLELDDTSRLPYALVKNLGHGRSAIVEMVRDTNSNKTYARKVFRNIYARNLEEAKRAFYNELQVMRRLKSHRHIIRIFATYIAQRELALILTPVATDGDLAAFLHTYRDMGPSHRDRVTKEAILWKAFGCLGSGLAFMHKQTIRHKDIKPQNILVHQGSVLFADFGIAFDFEHGRSTTTGHPNSFTRRYCAPEVADWDKRNSKSDVFSLGCVYVEILDALQPDLLPAALLKGPFHQTLKHTSLKQLPQQAPGSVYYHILLLIPSMVAFDSEARMSAPDVVAFLSPDVEAFLSVHNTNLFCISCIQTTKSYRTDSSGDTHTDIDGSGGYVPRRLLDDDAVPSTALDTVEEDEEELLGDEASTNDGNNEKTKLSQRELPRVLPSWTSVDDSTDDEQEITSLRKEGWILQLDKGVDEEWSEGYDDTTFEGKGYDDYPFDEIARSSTDNDSDQDPEIALSILRSRRGYDPRIGRMFRTMGGQRILQENRTGYQSEQMESSGTKIGLPIENEASRSLPVARYPMRAHETISTKQLSNRPNILVTQVQDATIASPHTLSTNPFRQQIQTSDQSKSPAQTRARNPWGIYMDPHSSRKRE